MNDEAKKSLLRLAGTIVGALFMGHACKLAYDVYKYKCAQVKMAECIMDLQQEVIKDLSKELDKEKKKRKKTEA